MTGEEDYDLSDDNILYKEFMNIINGDLYAWVCCWGEPRLGKSNLCLLIGYFIYQDWDKVLDSVVFNLNGLIYKIQRGKPVRWWTSNKLHNRIPYLFMDDFGAHCNKAKTQHEKGWDIFKGGFDTLGTMVGVLVANMVAPDEATQQLNEKYTHEIWVHEKGVAKFDKVKKQQDYKAWKSRQKKDWLWEFDFPRVPEDVFKEYDEMRLDLAKEVLFSIVDTMQEENQGYILKRIQPIDINLLYLLKRRGTADQKFLIGKEGPEVKDAIVRMKSRGLVVPIRGKSKYYRYDLTDLGLQIVDALEEEGRTPVDLKQKSKSQSGPRTRKTRFSPPV